MRQWRRRHRKPFTVLEEEPRKEEGAEAYGVAHGGPRVNGSAEGRRNRSWQTAATEVGEEDASDDGGAPRARSVDEDEEVVHRRPPGHLGGRNGRRWPWWSAMLDGDGA